MPHKLGQVFLIDNNIISKIVNSELLNKDENIVEIGCGDGAMSLPLAKKVRHLTIVELDQKCIDATQITCQSQDNITYIHQDILKTNLSELYPKPYFIIANIPYYLSAKLIQQLVVHRTQVKRATLMVQKEFATKLTANTGKKDHTSLTLYTQFYFTVKSLFDVSKTCFKPIPKIDSTVIQLTPRSSPLFEVNEERFFKLINSAFWGRRKQLISALKKSPFISLKKGFESCDFFNKNKLVRGETLDLTSFYEMYKELETKQFFM
tara:strand:- start:10428 stop:11219 length:792 start_codon:yes stop_codon:yes gene_type:complete